MKKSLINTIWAALCLMSIGAYGQETGKLSIGDPAPEVRYSKWIKGNPIKSLDGDQLYVLEFWATWCGPCKAAMPHITELQAKYKGKATFIGVGVWEKVPADQPYESALPSVEKYVKGNDANMGYSVIADNNEQYMGNKWLRAAGENGIPSTFIVKENKILWIGHPNSLDSILPKMFAGTYDMQAYKTSFEKHADKSRDQAAKMTAVMSPVSEALKAKDFRKAFELMEKVKTEQPQMKIAMEMMKLGVLVESFNLQEVQKFASTWDYKGAPSLILGEIYKRENLPKETYLWAAKNFGSTDQVTNPLIFDALATCYAKAGDFVTAVVHQEKAFESAKKALKEGTMVGTIMDYTVAEYEKKLKQYKDQVN
jgi:thiol-disulfide isomerase/thioredoxin